MRKGLEEKYTLYSQRELARFLMISYKKTDKSTIYTGHNFLTISTEY